MTFLRTPNGAPTEGRLGREERLLSTLRPGRGPADAVLCTAGWAFRLQNKPFTGSREVLKLSGFQNPLGGSFRYRMPSPQPQTQEPG